jgi:simple sugar transport system ATP-binding protein
VFLQTDKNPTEPGDVVLSTDRLSAEDNRGIETVSGVSFDVREGEVFGIAGVDGNGQSELIESITGLRDPTDGRVTYLGEDVTHAPRSDRIDAGMAYIPEDRHERGLVMEFDLVQNGILGSQHSAPFATRGNIDWGTARGHTEDIIREYDVRPPNPDADAESLSGGNQQKFIVGREFEREPELVVATHPTRGVDIGSTEFIHDRLLELRDAGKAVLLVSSKLDEVQGLSDRLAVMHDGEFMDVVDPQNVTEEEIGLLMAGERPETESQTEDAVADGGAADEGTGADR